MLYYSLRLRSISNTLVLYDLQEILPKTYTLKPVGETLKLGRVKRIWYLSPLRAVKVQASLRIRAFSPESPLLAHRSSESRGTFGQKARFLAPLNGRACAVTICHDGMLEDTNSLGAAQKIVTLMLIH